MSIDIGGIEAKTWGYSAETGEPAIETTAGDVLQVDITNELPEATSIHWHGIALHVAADGVPGMTQSPIEPGQSFSYVFEPPMEEPTSTTPTAAYNSTGVCTPL